MADVIRNERMVQPLPDYIEVRGYTLKSEAVEGSTVTASLGNLSNVLYHLKKGDESNAINAFKRYDRTIGGSKTGIKARDWSTGGIVRTWSERLETRMFQEFNARFMLKILPLETANFVKELSTSVYYAKKNGESIPPTEIVGVAGQYVLSLFIGKNYAFEILPHSPRDAGEIAHLTLENIDRLTQYVLQQPRLTQHMTREEFYTKHIARWSEMANHVPADISDFIRRNAQHDAAIARDALQSRGWEPNFDATMMNVNEEGGQWFIDNERARLLVPPGYQRAQTIWDPALSLTLDDRVTLQEPLGLDDAWEALVRLTGWRIERGIVVPFKEWIPRALQRHYDYCDLLQQLSAVPYIRHRYRLASIAPDISFSSIPVSIRCTDLEV